MILQRGGSSNTAQKDSRMNLLIAFMILVECRRSLIALSGDGG